MIFSRPTTAAHVPDQLQRTGRRMDRDYVVIVCNYQFPDGSGRHLDAQFYGNYIENSMPRDLRLKDYFTFNSMGTT